MVRPVVLRSSLLLVALPLWLGSSAAQADLIDPAEEACAAAGEACEVNGEQGACKAETCSRLDYGNPDPDGTPGVAEYECVRCIPGAKPEKVRARDRTPDEAPHGDEGSSPPAADPPATTKGSRCAVEPTTTSMLSVALGLGLLVLGARRRRR